MALAKELSNWEQQTLALSAVVHAAQLVRDMAYSGEASAVELEASVNPLLVLSAPDMGGIYTNLAGMRRGLHGLEALFGNQRSQEHAEVVRYTLGMLVLRNKLMKNNRMQETLHRRLQHIDPLIGGDEMTLEDSSDTGFSTQERSFQQLAKLYQDTISTLSYRVQVQGKVDFLKDEKVANRIRALLLAGIRSAVLWYQLEGRRWRLVLYRRRIQHTAATLARRIALTSEGTDVRSSN
jgi:high frequency lysogenization protein